MKVLILYRPQSEHSRIVEDFVRDYRLRHEEGSLEVVDADSRDGSASAALYGVMQYPAILALREDGTLLHSWEGENLPLMDDVAYYAFSG